MLGNHKIADRININLLLVLLLATLLRVCFLSQIPNGFYHDEATTGYDAYSLLKTGHNQYGDFLPLFSKAFSDYNESLSRFITVPFIGIFGLNEFATRLPVALIGTLTVLIIYYLAKELFDKKIALFSTLFLAISPWHIQFSRIGFTAILVPFFFCWALLFFVKSFKKPKYLYLSAIPFGLSLYTYSPARVFIPIFMLCLMVMFWHHLWQHKKQTLIACTIFFPIFILLFSFWISPEGMTRVKSLGGVTTDPIQIFHDYLSYFSPNFLFFSGDSNPRHSPPRIGELHLIELITIPIGVFFLSKEESKKRNILFLWLLLYPIPAALTAPEHALRSIVGSPLFSIISGYGLSRIWEMLFLPKKILSWITLFAISIHLMWFMNSYFRIYPKKSTYRTWSYGIKEAISYAQNSSYDCIIVSNQFRRVHIFVLFYTQYDPSLYQISPIEPSLSLQSGTDYFIGKYRITSISDNLVIKDSCFVIIKPDEIDYFVDEKYNLQKKRIIKNPRGNEDIALIEVKNRTSEKQNRN